MEFKQDRIPRLVHEWEKSLGSKGWISDVEKIASTLHLPSPEPDAQVLYGFENVENAVMDLLRKQWWEDALTKSKLETYVQFRSKDNYDIVAKMKLNRHYRSLLSRLAADILPIEIEIGRCTNVKHEKSCASSVA